MYPKPGSPVHNCRKFSAVLRKNVKIFGNAQKSLLGNHITPQLHCDPSQLLPIRSHVKVYTRQGCSLEGESKLHLAGKLHQGSKYHRLPQLRDAWRQLRRHKPMTQARSTQKPPVLERLFCQGLRPLSVKQLHLTRLDNPHHQCGNS